LIRPYSRLWTRGGPAPRGPMQSMPATSQACHLRRDECGITRRSRPRPCSLARFAEARAAHLRCLLFVRGASRRRCDSRYRIHAIAKARRFGFSPLGASPLPKVVLMRRLGSGEPRGWGATNPKMAWLRKELTHAADRRSSGNGRRRGSLGGCRSRARALGALGAGQSRPRRSEREGYVSAHL
jgi:hypothetical protein